VKVFQATANRAPIMLIYGAEGRGKTTLASKPPKPIALLLERGLPRGVSIDAFENTTSFDAVMAALREIYTNTNGYQTLVIDTIDALEALLVRDLCAKNNWKNIETPPYGKGWIAADDSWRQFIRAITAIRDRHDMSAVMTCHAEIVRVDDPRVPSYTAYQPRLHKRARGIVMDACDAVFFLSEDLHVVREGEGFRERTRAASSAQRFLFTEGRPAFAAKNRFGMAPKIPIPLDLDFGTLAQCWAN
jgi:AAA domain